MGREVRVLDRTGIGSVECSLEGASHTLRLMEDSASGPWRRATAGSSSGWGKGWSAGFKHLSKDSVASPSGPGRLDVDIAPREPVGVVKGFYGVVCAPTVKLSIPWKTDLWLMLLVPRRQPGV